MPRLPPPLCLLVLTLLGSCVKGQNINRSLTPIDEDSGFKPPFPIECRVIDYATWESTALALEPARLRCLELYGTLETQEIGFSTESYKICMESYKDYGVMHTFPAPEFKVEMFCNVAVMDTAKKKVIMNQYLSSKLATVATIADHDLYRQFQRWVDDTNLKLLDQFEEGLYSGTAAEALSQECIQAVGAYWCTKAFPNCTYMLKARWPYDEMEEKIYTCKETCDEVLEFCPAGWLPYPIRCVDYVSKAIDEASRQAIVAYNEPRQKECDAFGFSVCEGVFDDNAYNRRDFGGHACASTTLARKYMSGAAQRSWSVHLLLCAIGAAGYLHTLQT